MSEGKPCTICGDPEPHHVHNRGERIENYFLVGRGQSDEDAARSWQRKFVEAKAERDALAEALREYLRLHGEYLAALARVV